MHRSALAAPLSRCPTGDRRQAVLGWAPTAEQLRVPLHLHPSNLDSTSPSALRPSASSLAQLPLSPASRTSRTAASAPVAAQFRVSGSGTASGAASCPGPVPICAKAIIIPPLIASPAPSPPSPSISIRSPRPAKPSIPSFNPR
ncbi:hypothetical protein CCMA1212_006239 [Trichoderma ghanense]|uniref:Uncharacterized protein n=1 Tax=Trichoderma ghanense TaxID=65468 RepID=A0ABY2H0L1_9HYPO